VAVAVALDVGVLGDAGAAYAACVGGALVLVLLVLPFVCVLCVLAYGVLLALAVLVVPVVLAVLVAPWC
jgi:hypothetical protein